MESLKKRDCWNIEANIDDRDKERFKKLVSENDSVSNRIIKRELSKKDEDKYKIEINIDKYDTKNKSLQSFIDYKEPVTIRLDNSPKLTEQKVTFSNNDEKNSVVENKKNPTMRNYKSSEDNSTKIKKNSIKPYSMTKSLLKEYKFRYYSERLYIYKPKTGDFQYISDHGVHVLIMEYFPDKIKKRLNTYLLNQILHFIKIDKSSQISTVDVFSENTNFINFKNGMLHLYPFEFITSHSPDYNFFYHLNAKYKEGYKYEGSKFQEYIYTATQGNKELEYILQEVFGYCISTFNCAKKAFIISGLPNSGKSLFLNLLKEIVGQTNCSFVELQRLSERFQTAQLHGKLLNINAELGDDSIKDTGMLKSLTGQDVINAERKSENPFEFVNHARLIFACNELPNIKKIVNSKAFFDRLIIVPFNCSVPSEKQDKNLLEKLCKEKSEIINWALEGLGRLKNNNFVFTKSKLVEEMKKMYLRSNNNVIDFMEECCTVDSNSKAHISALYARYVSYCKDNELTVVKQNQFTSVISNTYNFKKAKFRLNGGSSLWGFEGISILEKTEKM